MSQVSSSVARRVPVGAEFLSPKEGTHFRVWAPQVETVEVVYEAGGGRTALQPEGNGYFSAIASDALPGTNYKYSLNGGEAYPDPISLYQPKGPHGFSQVVDPSAFRWSDANWPGVKMEGQVIYEMHLGTFTPAGTWASASEKLEYLRDTGITLIEVMPVADFPGRFGWGYDGVHPFAPASIYGTPDDMRAFVDRAHAYGLGVVLDVVYNHLGPDGNYFPKFSPFYFSEKHTTDWGPAINFDDEHSAPVREVFRANAGYWIRDFHLDGLRLDATQDIHDDTEPHIIAELARESRAAAGRRSIVLIGENEPQKTRLIKPPEESGYGLDALWNDDYHHSAMVALTGRADAYYTDYRGTPQEFVSAFKYGYLFQGQWYRWQKKRRGSSTLGLPRTAMVTFIQNHDQVANSARGQRCYQLSSPSLFKAITAATLLSPGTPMLFQGQEFASSSRFLFFADHKPDLAKLIENGRVEFLSQWRSLSLPEMRGCFEDPSSEATFKHSKLDHSEVKKHSEIYALHRDLLRVRRQDPVVSRQGADGIDGAVLSPSAFLIRYFSPGFTRDRLLLVNLGVDLDLNPAPEPLLAPPEFMEWGTLWSSESPDYGGCGTAQLDTDENWKIPGLAAVLLHPIPIQDSPSVDTLHEQHLQP